MTESIAFIDLKAQYAAMREDINARIGRVLDHGHYIMGPEVAELEARLGAYTGVGDVVTVASGTEALLIALMALGIGPGDEVITTAFTFVATAEAIALVGATPVFVDIEPDTCNIDASLIEPAIGPRTKAILPVALYGQPADMDAINAVANRHGLAVIEDAAQSFGARYGERRSCGLTTIGCTSFFPSKPLGCYGDGGALFTSDPRLAKIMREIRVHGQERRYYHTRVGVGGRMDTLQCAVVLAKLERLDWELDQRAGAGLHYLEALAGNEALALPKVRPDRTCVWAQFTVQVADRDRVAAALQSDGIPTAIHYPIPLHRQPAYGNICRISGSLQNADLAASRVLSLPIHAYISPATQTRICNALTRAVA